MDRWPITLMSHFNRCFTNRRVIVKLFPAIRALSVDVLLKSWGRCVSHYLIWFCAKIKFMLFLLLSPSFSPPPLPYPPSLTFWQLNLRPVCKATLSASQAPAHSISTNVRAEGTQVRTSLTKKIALRVTLETVRSTPPERTGFSC